MNTFKVTFFCKELGLTPTIQVSTDKSLSELEKDYSKHFLGKPVIRKVS